MKNKSVLKLGGAAAVLVASFALPGVARADMINANAELGILGTDFSAPVSGAKAPEFDSSQYEKVNTGPLSSTLWAPKRGAQGPMRDESTKQQEMLWKDIESRLGPVGGRNTP